MKTIILLVIPFFIVLAQEQRTDNSLFDFKADVRLFTAYAFMNVAGNNSEWRKAGMHPIRIAVREELKNKIDSTLQKKMKDFSNSHGGSWCIWGNYSLISNGPPDFRMSYDPKTTDYGKEEEEQNAGLSELFSQFYLQADITKLWQKYQPTLQAENDRFKPFAQKGLDDIESYCRLKKGFFARNNKCIHFQFCPLMLYWTAWEMKVNGETWIVTGPQEGQPDPSVFYHEALHPVIGPLTAKYSTEISRSSELLPISKSNGSIGYNSWPERVEDCFTRTLDKVLQGKLSKLDSSKVIETLEAEYKLGFILCFSIYESLQAYEKQEQSFEVYYPTILKNIDVAKEKQRWEKFWSEHKQ
jgi:hypothetical protein